LAAAIQGTAAAKTTDTLGKTFARLQNDKAERTLIEQLPALLDWLGELSPEDRVEVRSVLLKINRGQLLDLQRFGAGNEIRALKNGGELDEYTYLVAGCVGEFWTRLCFEHVKDFSARPESEMSALGVLYGQGLQLVNILRDAGNDLRAGRCYFPADELDSLGLSPSQILSDPSRIEPALKKWREKAQSGIEAGREYAAAIRSRRVRFATALPAKIGAQTLALLREAGAGALTRRIKVPRADVRKMILSSALGRSR
jgi:farnesyl-diphosphate farnesyltransferase